MSLKIPITHFIIETLRLQSEPLVKRSNTN